MNKTIKITPFTSIGEDSRGCTAEIALGRKQDNFVFLSRKKDSLSGNTYHEGKSDAVKPKIFLLLTGEIEFSYRHVGKQDKYQEIVQAPAMIEIPPLIIHNVKALTDIMLIECNSIKDVQNDRIKEDV